MRTTTHVEFAGMLFPIHLRETPSGAYLGHWFTSRGVLRGRCKCDNKAEALAHIQADIAYQYRNH
jgi:hypothetical protein